MAANANFLPPLKTIIDDSRLSTVYTLFHFGTVFLFVSSSCQCSTLAVTVLMFLLLIQTLMGLVGYLVAARLFVCGSPQLPPWGGTMSYREMMTDV